VTDHKFLEDVHEDSLQIPRQNSRFLYNRLDKPLKASGCPTVSISCNVEYVWMSKQHRSDSRSSFSNFYTELDFNSRHCLGSLYKTSRRHGYTSGRCPAFQNIHVLRLNAERSYSEDRPDVYLLWKEFHYSGRRSQKTVRTRLTSDRTIDSQSSNLYRFRFSLSV
jgi:hypothetical protein